MLGAWLGHSRPRGRGSWFRDRGQQVLRRLRSFKITFLVSHPRLFVFLVDHLDGVRGVGSVGVLVLTPGFVFWGGVSAGAPGGGEGGSRGGFGAWGTVVAALPGTAGGAMHDHTLTTAGK